MEEPVDGGLCQVSKRTTLRNNFGPKSMLTHEHPHAIVWGFGQLRFH
jgi:hypothetical protein